MSNTAEKQQRKNSDKVNEYFVRIYTEYNKDVCPKTLIFLVKNEAIKPVFVRQWVAWHYYNETRKSGVKKWPAHNQTADYLGLECAEAVRYLLKNFKFSLPTN